MLTGLLAPTSGEVLVCGLNVAQDPLAVKRRIGVLPEDLGLFDDLTVEEHLLLTGRIYGLSRETARARVEQLLSALSLAHGRDTFAGHCSHGMRKKTAFAMALLPNPEVLFLDEPFEAIDPVTSKTMRDLLGDRRRQRRHRFSDVAHSAGCGAHRRSVRNDSRRKDGLEFCRRRTAAILEDLYFELAEEPVTEDLDWLGPRRS